MHDLEKKVLGALLVDSSCRPTIIPLLKEGLFLDDFHKKVCSAIVKLDAMHQGIDPLSILTQFESIGSVEQDDAYKLTQLTYEVVNGNNAEQHTRYLIEQWMRRQGSAMAKDYAYRLEDITEDVFEILDKFQQDLGAMSEFIVKGKNQHISISAQKVQAQAEKAKESGDVISGLPTGLTNIDVMTGGLKAPDLVIVAARPGMGKTSLAINMAQHIAQTTPVGVFSLEMSATQLTRRILSGQTGYSTQEIETGRYDYIADGIQKISGLHLYFNDTAGITTTELQNACRQMVAQYGVKVIFVDYIQLMQCKGYNSREQEVSAISRNLKAIAKKLNIPIIALSQLSRKCEERADKRPLLSDLRESGGIEQDADLVAFIYRGDYYGITQDEYGESTVGDTEFIISKHRGGATGTVQLHFDASTTTFTSQSKITQF